MKTKLVKSIMAPLLTACALVTMVAATAAGQGTVGGRLQGTWDMQITLTDCRGHVLRSFPSLVIFMAGHTMMESNAGTPQALKTPGEGVWRHTTDNNYVFRFKSFSFNTQNVFTGWTIIQADVSLDSTGDAYTSSASIEFYDANGVLLGTGCAESAGTRFEL